MARAVAGIFVTTLATLLVSAPAAAVPRFASPTGPDSGTCAEPDPPCSITWAIESASANGDEVVVLPGDHTVGSTVNVSNKQLDIHGAAGQGRPRLVSSVSTALQISGTAAGGTRVADLQIEAPGVVVVALPVGTASVLERLVVLAGAGTASSDYPAVDIQENWLLRDSVVRTISAGGVAVRGGNELATAVNVTATATDPTGIAFQAWAPINGLCIPPFVGQLNVTNAVARGGLYDLDAPGVCGTGGDGLELLNVSHSNYRLDKVNQDPPRSWVQDHGGNQHSEPIFAAPASLDFRQLAGSPTIDGGATHPFLGTADPDGNARTLGSAPDIGSDEFPPPPPSPVTPPTDRRAPGASLLAMAPRAFRAARRGGSIVRRGGGRVSYALDEDATMTFTVQREVVRRRRTRRSRFVRVRGSFTHRGSIGGNSFRFSGRLRGRRLRRGSYRLTARPRDGAGNVGRPARARFRIR